MIDKGLTMHTVFLSLGTNLGDRYSYLQTALTLIEESLGKIVARSSVHETKPWGFNSEQNFLNMAVKVKTRLLPIQVLYITQAIEREMGRTKKSGGIYEDRIIDIDIILYDEVKMDRPELTLPHPLYKERDFVLIPLSEIL